MKREILLELIAHLIGIAIAGSISVLILGVLFA